MKGVEGRHPAAGALRSEAWICVRKIGQIRADLFAATFGVRLFFGSRDLFALAPRTCRDKLAETKREFHARQIASKARTSAHPRTSRKRGDAVPGLHSLPSFSSKGLRTSPMNLVTLDWTREPHLCQAVIRETQEYRHRDPPPLAPIEPFQLTPVHRRQPAPVEPYLDGCIFPLDQDFRQVYEHLLSLPERAHQRPQSLDLNGMMKAAVDWAQRNRAIFCPPNGPCWLQQGTRAVNTYKCMMNELIHDLRSIVDQLHANWQRIPDDMRHAALCRVMLQVKVIFVCPSILMYLTSS